MANNFFEYFESNKYDKKIILKSSDKNYSVLDVKNLLKNSYFGNNEAFQIILETIKNVLENKEYIFHFSTSGSASNKGKIIEKKLLNFELECNDLTKQLGLNKYENLEFYTTTTLKHIYGFAFQFIIPFLNGNVVNIDRINYPEDVNFENAVLITTPSFLDMMKRYNVIPKNKPKIIMTAGAKIKDDLYKFAETIADRVIDIYGSTETNTIGFRESSNTNKLTLLDGVEIISTGIDGTTIKTNYSIQNLQHIGDSIKLDGRNFEVLGRLDRTLKIQEKRIDLNILENKIKENEMAADCFCFEHKNKVACLLVPTEIGKKALLNEGKIEVIKKLKKFLKDDFEIIPQRWKFYDEIPVNERGKINKEKIKEIFNLNLSLPLILNSKIEKEKASFELCFLSDSNFFKGHFENFPILAGVVQLFYADFFIKRAFKIDCHEGQIRKIKFSNIIRPNKKVQLNLIKNEKNVSFEYSDDNKAYSGGVFPIKNYFVG